MKSSNKSRGLFLTAVAMGAMLNPLNSSMIALALYQIQKDFGLSYLTVSWLISSFYLASAVAQPVAGKLGDLIGRKKMFLGGLILVTISAVGAPLAPAFAILVIMRLFQAVGSGSIYPSGMGMVRDHIHERQGAALGFISVFMSAMAALGPTIGGILIAWGGWEAIFLVNIPVLLFCFFLAWFVLPKDESRKKLNLHELKQKMDIIGTLLFSVGIVGILLFLLSFKTTVNVGAGMIGVSSILLFVRHELNTKVPFIDIRIFRYNRKLTLVYLQYIVLNLIYYCLFFGLPGYFQDGLHLSVSYSGMLMLFVSGMGIITAPLIGRWIDKAGVNTPILAGNLLIVIGALLLWLFFDHVPIIVMVLIISLIGAGCSFGNVTLQAAMLEASPGSMIGVSTGLYQMCRHLGSTLSAVTLGLIFGDHFNPEHFTTLILVLITAGIVIFLLGMRFSRTKSESAAA
ncbi:MFS transporter [Bacillus benzoevorans]|uniref:EmrB/QacA subfamily drug resistance transporter n=1 Tax=Bacillus benzoevorans TaxID=1456 RepID=A0A7X0LVR0_9BACI|nr:MFS transporter [Bacillus benzoevorans]MBB6444837.1 EmrB/QacA subfamily drug resistance transporter [Bacillus benzoevorans]